MKNAMGLRIGLLSKKRGNIAIQERFSGRGTVVDATGAEVEHHRRALRDAGHTVRVIPWSPDIVRELQASPVDLVFNVSSLAEAALLEELEIPFAGSDTSAIAVSLNKALAKKLWRQQGLPTSPFRLARSENDCAPFRTEPPFEYPLFIKPLAGRGSAGVDATSVVHNYEELVRGVTRRLDTIRMPVLIERYLRGREITLGVLGNDEPRVLPPLEIVYREGDVTLSFEKKELDNDSFLCPARLSEEESHRMGRLAVQAYRALGFRDFGRVDTLVTDEGPFLLEGNAFAGLMCTPPEKPHSYMGFMARAEGVDAKGLLGEVVHHAAGRLWAASEKITDAAHRDTTR